MKDPLKETCTGSCGEEVPVGHEGALTESCRTVIHHPKGTCHYLKNSKDFTRQDIKKRADRIDPLRNRIDPMQNASDWKDTEYKKLEAKILINLVLNALTLLAVILVSSFFIGVARGLIN